MLPQLTPLPTTPVAHILTIFVFNLDKCIFRFGKLCFAIGTNMNITWVVQSLRPLALLVTTPAWLV